VIPQANGTACNQSYVCSRFINSRAQVPALRLLHLVPAPHCTPTIKPVQTGLYALQTLLPSLKTKVWRRDLSHSYYTYISPPSPLSHTHCLKLLTHHTHSHTMRSGFVTVKATMADSDRDEPQPTPFPIRIVHDSPPPPPSDIDNLPPPGPIGKRTDQFYEPWEKFLAIEPSRGQRLSRPAAAVAAEQAEVDHSPGAEGKKVQENAATSWEQAAECCRKKVAAIVEECRRLNQKYRDAIFDLEASPWCLQSLHGRFPKV